MSTGRAPDRGLALQGLSGALYAGQVIATLAGAVRGFQSARPLGRSGARPARLRRVLPGVVALALGLAACAPATTGFRDTRTPMGATLRFDAGRFAGPWHVVARMGSSAEPETFDFAAPGAGWQVTRSRLSCTAAGCARSRADRPVRMVAPGRIEVGGQVWWVLWVDDDFRTAAIGTPDGSFGWIMDRKGPKGISADRLNAAKEIMDWAGYDLGRLQMVTGTVGGM